MHPYPGYPPTEPKPPRRAGDLTGSIVALVWAGFVLAVGGLIELMSLAFIDGCTDDCDPAVFTRRITITLLSSLAIAMAGGGFSIVRLAQRRLAWPIAVMTAVLVTAIYALSLTIQFTPA